MGANIFIKPCPLVNESVFESANGKHQAYAMSTEPPSDGSLGAWKWYPASTAEESTGTYHALYPLGLSMKMCLKRN
jgi:non-lysosomal glucosylceramidase